MDILQMLQIILQFIFIRLWLPEKHILPNHLQIPDPKTSKFSL